MIEAQNAVEALAMPVAAPHRLIVVDGVSKAYVSQDVVTHALRDVSCEILEGEFAAVFGHSGSGKTTLLSLIGGLDRPTSGEVYVDGVALSRLSERGLTEYRRSTIGFVFQSFNLLPTLTALENVEALVELTVPGRRRVRERALTYLERVGLLEKAGKFPSQLSGGEQQRVAVAGALAKEPRIILADEPTGNLDLETGQQVLDLMLDLQKRLGITFVVVTHNRAIAQVADRVISVASGRIG